MSEPGAKRAIEHNLVLSLLARRGRPLKVGELVSALRESGLSDNPGGVLLGMVADGTLVMDQERRLQSAARLMVA